MAITKFQRILCKIISDNRKVNNESYIAGGIALNHLIDAPRLSHDIDIFNDSKNAVYASFELDSCILKKENYELKIIRDRNGFIEADISKGNDSILVQWTTDSCFRFFPLLEDKDFGLTMHPFDLATNKILALAGRLEVRDWIDVINCSDKIQHLGFLVYASCAKDPGFSPEMILQEATRSSHYSQIEYDTLTFKDNEFEDLAIVSKKWKRILSEANDIINKLPYKNVGSAVMTQNNELYIDLDIDLEKIYYHKGTMFGAYPIFVNE